MLRLSGMWKRRLLAELEQDFKDDEEELNATSDEAHQPGGSHVQSEGISRELRGLDRRYHDRGNAGWGASFD